MSDALKVLAGVLIAVILGLTLRQQGKDMALLLSILACCMVLVVCMVYIEPVIDFIETLQSISGAQNEIFQVLLKSVGIGLIGEIASLVCSDSGNAALAKAIQILTSAVVLWLSLPLMQALLELVKQMLEEV